MKIRFALQVQILLSVIVALLSGYLLEGAAVLAQTAVETPAATPQPFETRQDMLSVRLRFFRSAAPEVVSVEPLAEGRLTVTQGGDCTVMLQDEQGRPVYTLAVAPIFVRTEGGTREMVERILVIPNDALARWLVVSCLQGEVKYDLANNR